MAEEEDKATDDEDPELFQGFVQALLELADEDEKEMKVLNTTDELFEKLSEDFLITLFDCLMPL